MAKGRRLPASGRQDRLLGTYGHRPGDYTAASDLPDLGEDDIWSVAAAEGSGMDEPPSSRSQPPASNTNRERRWNAGGLSLAFNDDGYYAAPSVLHHHRRQRQSPVARSAPVNVPDWPQILRVDSADSLQGSVEVEDDDGGDEVEWMPPHEYLAREHGKTVTTSVFEGVGRTLKGRDMSRVRNAVWRQTGFFG